MRSLSLLASAVGLTAAFAPANHVARSHTQRHQRFSPISTSSPLSSSTTTSLRAAPILESVGEARIAFFLWFFGASGAAGIGRSSFVNVYNSVQELKELNPLGPTKGGETLGISPLCGYPRDLSIADVEQVVNNPLSCQQIAEKYLIEDNFLSQKGYLTYAAFAKANAQANPLAVRAVFDTFAQATNTVEPEKAQKLLNGFKGDVRRVKNGLLLAKATGFFAFFTLLFLLGFADVVAAGHAYQGWFPDWPGGQNFPACLLDPETGPWTIPQYWLSDDV